MDIRPQFIPTAMPKGYTTKETRARMVQHYLKDDEGKFERDDNGKKIKAGPAKMVIEEVETTGGVLFTMPRGHSVRLTSPDQIKTFKVATKPRLVDLDTGEECDEEGRPISLVAFVTKSRASYDDVASELIEEDTE